MTASVSSLLVRDGLVGVKRMEKAFQRQVIYGGSLDTILLEMNLVPEERLTQYLALASGLPPAPRAEPAAVAPEVLQLIDSEIATQFRAIPLLLEGEALKVLVCAPLEISQLEDLADLLDRPLQPLIPTEYPWPPVYASAYKTEAPARFTTLARTLAVDDNAATAAGNAPKPPTVIVDESATQPLVAPPRPRRKDDAVPATLGREEATEKIVFETPLPASGTQGRPRSSTLPGMRAVRPQESAGVITGVGIPPRAPAVAGQKPATGNDNVKSRPGSGRVAEPIPTAGRDSPLAIVRARELLATAEDRDTVFVTLLRAARARARYAGLLTVQGGAAIGRLALAEGGIDTASITTVLVPLDAASPFRAVVQGHQPYIGPLTSGDANIDAMILRMGGAMPPSALLMPVVLRERAIASLIAHRGHSNPKLIDVTEVPPPAQGAADALGRLIVKHKSAGYKATTGEQPKVEIASEAIDTKRMGRGASAAGEWKAVGPDERPSVPSMSAELPVLPPEPARPIAAVLDAIENGGESSIERDVSEAVERANETLGELARRFPGKLRIDRFSVAGRALRAAQYGGLLELVVKLGPAAGDLLVDRLSSPNRDERFYATVCAAELRLRNAVFALVERLFDQDFGVRTMAIEALAGYPATDLTQALPKARRALHSSDVETVAAATAAIVQLGDVDAVEELIGTLDRGDRGAEHARKALVALTTQDFGTSERKWRKWWEGAKRRHRIEWLIDGLGHKEDAIRETAINTLRRLTGEYFGYHHDLARKERDMAAERWQSWWRETGLRRYVQKPADVDERFRPTGILPARKPD